MRAASSAGAAWILRPQRFRHRRDVGRFRRGPALRVALPLPGAHVGIGQALHLGAAHGRGRDEDALPLVTLPAARPFNHDCAQRRMFGRPPGERRIPARQKLQVRKIGAGEAKRFLLLEFDPAPAAKLLAALGALAIAVGDEDHDFVGFAGGAGG